MEDNKFNALIKLLDDEDPRVAEQIEGELFGLGLAGIERLEDAWEQIADRSIQTRLEELIYRIQVQHFTKEIYEWRLGGGKKLSDGWLLLNQIQYPTLDTQRYHDELSRLANRIWLGMNNGMNDLERLCVVNRMLFTSERFKGNYDEHTKPENNYLSYLIDTKRGSSLSLSAFYYVVCQALDIPLQVVNFHGYYALRYQSHDNLFFVDAYNKGLFFTPQQVTQFLGKLKVDTNLNSYKPLSNIYILLHLIKHLKDAYVADENSQKAEVFDQLLKDIEIRFQ